MAKIKMIVKTDKNINELKRKEVQSIDWSTFPFDEQIQFIDADTYHKLTKDGRRHVNRFLNDYTAKPVEFWNGVAEYDDVSLAENLWRSATIQTKGIMLSNHADWFQPFRTMYEYEIGQYISTDNGTDIITSFIKKNQKEGEDFQYLKDGYIFLADPRISLDEFNAPFEMDGVKYPTLLKFICMHLEDAYEHDEYPVLAPNHMLKSAGYNPICDLSPAFLERHDACNHGRLVAKAWIKQVTTDEKDFITWDEAVNYIRVNPSSFYDTQMMDYLEWWWAHSILSGDN